MKNVGYLFCLVLFVLIIHACGTDDDYEPEQKPTEPTVSPVVFNPTEVPYGTLSEYSFFEGDLKNQKPVKGVLPYDVITPLFSDYAHKLRFVWMPDSVKGSYNGDHNALDFENGTVFIKNFYYDRVQPGNVRRIIETRLMFMRDNNWEFAEYVWNTDQTEAYLDMSGSTTLVNWLDTEGVSRTGNYELPSESECFTCHKVGDTPFLIGPKPQNMNMDFAYTEGVKNQLLKWVEMGYLDNDYPSNIATVVAWDDVNQLLEDRVRSYLDMNCAHCHRDGSHCDYRSIRFAWEETVNPDVLGICEEPQSYVSPELTYIIAGGNPDRSALFYRLNSISEDVRMPLLGRTVVHEEGIQLIYEYISSLDPC